MEKPSLFKSKKITMDMCHVKGIMPFSNLDQELLKKYYSPSAVSLSMLLEAMETLKHFYGEYLFKTDDAKIFFPRDTQDPILLIYQIPTWEDGKWHDRKIASHSMVIAIAPRARLPDEKTDQFPTLGDLEQKNNDSLTSTPHLSTESSK